MCCRGFLDLFFLPEPTAQISFFHLPCHMTYCIYNGNYQNGINEGKMATQRKNDSCLTWVLQCFDNISCTFITPFTPHDIMSAGHPTLSVSFRLSGTTAESLRVIAALFIPNYFTSLSLVISSILQCNDTEDCHQTALLIKLTG